MIMSLLVTVTQYKQPNSLATKRSTKAQGKKKKKRSLKRLKTSCQSVVFDEWIRWKKKEKINFVWGGQSTEEAEKREFSKCHNKLIQFNRNSCVYWLFYWLNASTLLLTFTLTFPSYFFIGLSAISLCAYFIVLDILA